MPIRSVTASWPSGQASIAKGHILLIGHYSKCQASSPHTAQTLKQLLYGAYRQEWPLQEILASHARVASIASLHAEDD